MIKARSLAAGKLVTGKHIQKNINPIDGTFASQSNLLSDNELTGIFKQAKAIKINNAKTDFFELVKLSLFFKNNFSKFVDQIIKDSGFIQKDAEDLVNCSIEFCADYSLHLKEVSTNDRLTSFSFDKKNSQKIKFTSSPYGVIAVTTPRNTPLITELTAIIHALWSGNVLVLRPSPGVAGTVSLLTEGLLKCFSPDTLSKLFITFSDAKNFIDTALVYSNLIHYVGSTKYLESTLIAGIKRGVKVLVDGDGCSLVVVDSTCNIKEAARACYRGVVRCNGQICISIRAIVVEESVYENFCTHFLNFIKKTDVKPPGLNKQSDMGPLFTSSQAESILKVARKHKLLYGQKTPLSYGPNYISPVVLELEPNKHNFLKESVFGPIVGITSFKKDGWKRWLEENTINLTDAVFSKDKNFIKEFLATSKSPRKVVNLDPTIESVFEPWGAFLPSGWNDVSYWYSKYRNYFQLVENLEK
ncbi:MAG: aldehyde dehydrogenase family protein [Patescibacteria group bacterium]